MNTKWVMNSGFVKETTLYICLVWRCDPITSLQLDESFAVKVRNTLHNTESRVGFIIFIFYSQLSGWSCFITHTIMKRIFTFIHRVHSEEHYTAPTRLKHTQTVGEMNTRLLCNMWKTDALNSTSGSAELLFFSSRKLATDTFPRNRFNV